MIKSCSWRKQKSGEGKKEVRVLGQGVKVRDAMMIQTKREGMSVCVRGR